MYTIAGLIENRYISANETKTDQVKISFASQFVGMCRWDYCVYTESYRALLGIAKWLLVGPWSHAWERSVFSECFQASWISQRKLWDRQLVQKFEEFPTMRATTMRISAMPSNGIGLFVAPCSRAPEASKPLLKDCFHPTGVFPVAISTLLPSPPRQTPADADLMLTFAAKSTLWIIAVFSLDDIQ